jgi:hypothetical protein
MPRIILVALALTGLGLAQARGDDYPTREVHVICAYAPGTGADTLVRFFAEKLRLLAGKPMIVENKPSEPDARQIDTSLAIFGPERWPAAGGRKYGTVTWTPSRQTD